MSLKDCLTRIGLEEHESSILLGKANELMRNGSKEAEAATQALADYQSSLDDELKNIIDQAADILGIENHESITQLKQQDRGQIQLTNDEVIIKLGGASDLSTFLHEAGHLFLEMEAKFSKEFGVTKNQQELLDWLGLESFDKAGIEEHEKFAETFEVYLAEGEAPSLALRDSFAAFKRWLKRIYESIFTDPNLQRANLTPQIKEVFDRLLATEVEIEQVMANPAYDQYFRSKEQAGMTDKQWIEYQERILKSKNRVTETLDKQVLAELRKRRSKEWKEEKAPLILEERKRLQGAKVYQVIADITRFPLNYDRVLEITGLNRIPGRLVGKASKDGIDPEEYSSVYNYPSAKAMIDAILVAPSLTKAARDAAEARMINKYGDVLNDGTLENEALEAVHNEEHAKVVLEELRALGKKSKKPAIDRKLLKDE